MTDDTQSSGADSPVAGYEGVVYDLDGTIVRLTVDWDAVREDVEELYDAAGVELRGDLWDLVDAAAAHGLQQSVETTIANHERVGAQQSRRLDLADELLALDRPVAICSLNCEAACRLALETHGLDDAVDAVVGRDTVSAQKPSPDPLCVALDAIGIEPENAVFVGDSESDEETAIAAGVDFQWVTEGQRDQ